MKLWYLASPYTKYREGEFAASDLACHEAGRLLDAGILVFSPIAHFHAIRNIIGQRPHDFWLAADKPFMESCYGLIVLLANGWRESKGMQFEIEWFQHANKPVVTMNVGSVPDQLRV